MNELILLFYVRLQKIIMYCIMAIYVLGLNAKTFKPKTQLYTL